MSPPAIEEAAAEPAFDLTKLLSEDPELQTAFADSTRRRLQVLVAIPTPNKGLQRFLYRADAEYFYPASAVKLCSAYAALEKSSELKLSLKTPIRFAGRNGTSSLRRELEASLVFSDNEAHNRLLDFVGRGEVAKRMTRIGLPPAARVTEYLGESPGHPRRMQQPSYEARPGRWLAILSPESNMPSAPQEPIMLGTAHVDQRGRLVDGPMDFSSKNFIALRDLQDLLVALVRPGPGLQEQRVGLGLRQLPDREELLSILATLPGGSFDALLKPLHVGAMGANRHVRVIGKGGLAYGFAVENAFVLDETTGKSFFVAATIYANDNEIMNDDRYEYESVARTFMMRLGERLTMTLLP